MFVVAVVVLSASLFPARVSAQRQMEAVGRGVVAIHQAGGRVWVGWRLLGTDAGSLAFNVYRSTGAGRAEVACKTADGTIDGRGRVIGDPNADWRNPAGTLATFRTTIIPTAERFYTFMHDPQYRLSVAWQNVGYNQPPHTSFFVGHGIRRPPRPNIVEVRLKK